MPGDTAARPQFTADDQTYCETYLSHRITLFRLWDLATYYPNVASRIRVIVRRADPKRDYYYEDAFADAAIVVRLEWTNARSVCSYLSCNHMYPRGRQCLFGDVPRVFPSGDYTNVTACEPACYMLSVASTRSKTELVASEELHSNWDLDDDDKAFERYYSCSSEYMRMLKSGHYERRRMGDTSTAKKSVPTERCIANANDLSADSNVADTGVAPVRPLPAAAAVATSRTVDMPFLEYNKQCDCCELGNVELMNFFTQPWTRSAQHDVCRQDNIMIGDDLVRGGPDLNYATTARHSRTYCNVFDKAFDESTLTCEETWYDTALSYTFLGSAVLRLGRHAVHGDGCGDIIFPVDAARSEVQDDAVPTYKRSRNAWFSDVHRDWCLPPPNALLSDLGLDARDSGLIWTNDNAHGGTVRASNARDFSLEGHDVASRRARRSLQRRQPPAATTARRTRRDADVETSKASDKLSRTSRRFLEYDDEYDAIRRGSGGNGDSNKEIQSIDRTGSAIFRERVMLVLETIDSTVSSIVIQSVVVKLTRTAYHSVLRNVGRYMAGYASRTLIAMSMRTATARLLGAMMARLTTRLLLILGKAATVVGAVIAVVELIALVLDVMIMFGWDPGNYKREFDNNVYDDMVRGWNRVKETNGPMVFDPQTLLLMFSVRNERENGSGGGLFGEEDATTIRMRVTRTDSAPWYFSPFPAAVQALADDERERNDDDEDDSVPDEGRAAEKEDDREEENQRDDSFTRARPIVVADNEAICNVLWAMHYFRHRAYNSLGQHVDASFGGANHDDAIKITDAFIEENIRDNELAYMLRTSCDDVGMSRTRLVGAARRNTTRKLLNRAYDAMLVVTFVGGVLFSAIVPSSSFASLLFVFASLLAVPLLSCIAAGEIVAITIEHDRAYDVLSTGAGDRATDDAFAGELCDAILSFAVTKGGNDEPGDRFAALLRQTLRAALRDELRVITHA